jgi:hypothetical protein
LGALSDVTKKGGMVIVTLETCEVGLVDKMGRGCNGDITGIMVGNE